MEYRCWKCKILTRPLGTVKGSSGPTELRICPKCKARFRLIMKRNSSR